MSAPAPPAARLAPSTSAIAFAREVEAQIPSLRTYAMGLARSASEADDLLQDALVRIWRYRESFQADRSLRGWMFRVLRNEFRANRRRRPPWVEDVDGAFAGRVVCGPSQEWRLRCDEVVEALGRLPAPNRQALLLVALGYSYEEAAERCRCDVAVLKGRVHRARMSLAALRDVERPAGAGGAGRNGAEPASGEGS